MKVFNNARDTADRHWIPILHSNAGTANMNSVEVSDTFRPKAAITPEWPLLLSAQFAFDV